MNQQMLSEMKAVLPDPPPKAEIILIIPKTNAFSQIASSVLQVMYGDFSLHGRLFKTEEKAREYLLTTEADEGPRIVLSWNGRAFRLISSTASRG